MVGSIKQRLKIYLSIVFFLFNAIFFFGVYYRIFSQQHLYSVVLRAYGSEFLLFWCFALGLGCLFLLFPNKDGKLQKWYSSSIEEFTLTLDQYSPHARIVWITVSSALVLFLELCIIRWVSALIPELSQYRNFSLLACFLGISVGYLTGAKRLSFVPFLLPLLGLQYLQISLISLVYPTMAPSENFLWMITKSPLWQFIFIVIVCIAPGQLVGHLLRREPALKAYGANLLGSIIGVVVLNLMAAFWLPPWFWLLGVALMYLLMFHKLRTFIQGLAVFAVFLSVAYFVNRPSVPEIYSPYQRITIKPYGIGHKLGDGRLAVYSNDQYYQSFSAILTDKIMPQWDVEHYLPNADLGPVLGELKDKKVLALGSGAGANIPFLLKAGVDSVVAVDIDPTIVYLGKMLNANRPYWAPQVEVVVNDGRAFLRQSREKFDYIFFLWIDSLPYVMSSHGFRIDSFIYTRECFQQALEHLNPGGKILIYSWMNDTSSKRILLTLKSVTSWPISTFKVLPYDFQGFYIVSDRPVEKTGSDFVVPWEVDVSQKHAIKVLSDDWPFLYLAGDSQGVLRFFPFLGMVIIVSLVSVLLAVGGFREGSGEGPKGLLIFFLFGAAFMLVETISIMRVALLMGNTWQVTGYVIIAVLAMAFIGNYLVLRNFIKLNLLIVGGGLIASLLLCWGADANQLAAFFRSTPMATFVYLTILSLPIIFSSVLFSSLIKGHTRVDLALGSNLLGSMFGGCLEYAAMICGYKALIFLIIGIYLVALILFARQKYPAELTS